MKTEYIECECGSIEHTLRFVWDSSSDWNEMYVDVFLQHRFHFFKRIWYAIKYIFGFKSIFGHFEEVILNNSEIIKIRNLCNNWLKFHTVVKEFNFIVFLTEPKVNFTEVTDKLFKAGCDDGTFRILNGIYEIEFHRKAISLGDAISSSIQDILNSEIESKILRIDINCFEKNKTSSLTHGQKTVNILCKESYE